MICGVSKPNLLFSVVNTLKAEPTLIALVPKRNICAGTSDLNHLSASIDVIDGGDQIESEIRRQVTVHIVIRTRMANINRSDLRCAEIESIVLNCLLLNHNLDGAVSRFIEGSSESVESEPEDPNVRTRVIAMKYEYV